jgi:hypothetical protein
MGRPRKLPNPDTTKYQWEDIPVDLWRAARAKAYQEGMPIKAVLKLLLSAWVGYQEPDSPAPKS